MRRGKKIIKNKLRGGERRFLVVLRYLGSRKKPASSTGEKNREKKEHHRWLDTDSPGPKTSPRLQSRAS